MICDLPVPEVRKSASLDNRMEVYEKNPHALVAMMLPRWYVPVETLEGVQIVIHR